MNKKNTTDITLLVLVNCGLLVTNIVLYQFVTRIWDDAGQVGQAIVNTGFILDTITGLDLTHSAVG